MVESIVLDKKRILPCSAWLQGEFGMSGIFLGVPCKLGRNGLEEIIEVELTDEERAALASSADAVREIMAVPIQRTSIGKKLLMATSSIILFLYVVAHLAGTSRSSLARTRSTITPSGCRVAGSPLFPDEGVLWIARVVLLAALLVHVGAYIQLWRQKRRARTVGYRTFDPQVFNWMSRTMVWGGIAILGFVIFHILHLTTGHIRRTWPTSSSGTTRTRT
jgi:hypothetical protein